MAEAVLRMPSESPHGLSCSTAPPEIQRLPRNAQAAEQKAGLPRESGRPLSLTTRAFMEPRFGRDFSGVRVHTGATAERTAAGLQARAFTCGSDIWFGAGASEGDRHLMAHELTHVVQQGAGAGGSDGGPAGRVSARIQRSTITDDFLTFETAPAFLTSDYTVGDTAVEILRGTARYRSLLSDLGTAFDAEYGQRIPTLLTQYLGIRGNEVLCGGDAVGCCRNCRENCHSLGIAVPNRFYLFAELFNTGWRSGIRVPAGFRVTVTDSPEVATASVMYHELLHLWFYQYLCLHRGEARSEPSGHNGEYDPDFARMWGEAHRQIESAFRSRRPARPEETKPTGQAEPTAPPPHTTRELGTLHEARARRAGVAGGFRIETGAGGELRLEPGATLLPLVWGDVGYQFGAEESSRMRWRLLVGGLWAPGEPVGAVRAQVGLRILQEEDLRSGRFGRGPAHNPFYFDFNAGVLYRLDERPGEGPSPGVSGGIGLGKLWTLGPMEVEVGASATALYLWQLEHPGALIFGGHVAGRL